jgi:hypothetical protein
MLLRHVQAVKQLPPLVRRVEGIRSGSDGGTSSLPVSARTGTFRQGSFVRAVAVR